MGISAVLITYNEEANIDQCLKSLNFVDEIVVLDSFSSDRTIEIARQYTDKIRMREFTGFSDQKNASVALATEEWVLVIDADEVVTDELAAEIKRAVETGEFDYYSIPRLSYFLGRPIKHCGWYPDNVVRLVRRSKLRFPDRLVHESVIVDGKCGMLHSDLIHYSYRSMEDFTRKMINYSRAAAQQKMSEGAGVSASDLFLRPWLIFLKKYILKQGFRDGMHGLVLCVLTACSSALRYAMLWDMIARKAVTEEQTGGK
ncbi:MAG: glycosyltransferase family 2 protein [Armatimonadota bacterium]|nr:glycosyltransferase family 2 protein [bacterium]